MPPLIDLSGRRFGSLYVIERVKGRTGRPYYHCTCDCGKTTEILGLSLSGGTTKTCGCSQGEKHGLRRSREYSSWQAMKDRCYNKNNERYADWGGRGIQVCDEWIKSFTAFYNHIGPRPSPTHSIDRIDTNGNYEPGNVRWASQEEQQNNKRSNVYVSFDCGTLTVAQWCKYIGRDQRLITNRVIKLGETHKAALLYFAPYLVSIPPIPVQQVA